MCAKSLLFGLKKDLENDLVTDIFVCLQQTISVCQAQNSFVSSMHFTYPINSDVSNLKAASNNVSKTRLIKYFLIKCTNPKSLFCFVLCCVLSTKT